MELNGEQLTLEQVCAVAADSAGAEVSLAAAATPSMRGSIRYAGSSRYGLQQLILLKVRLEQTEPIKGQLAVCSADVALVVVIFERDNVLCHLQFNSGVVIDETVMQQGFQLRV